MKAVPDASVLIALAQVGKLDLLRHRFGAIQVPQVVWDEAKTATAALATAENEGWCERVEVTATPPVWQRLLGPGEAQAITLALEYSRAGEQVVVLLDELRARSEAQHLGLNKTGVLGILLDAKSRGHIAEIRPILDQLKSQHAFNLSDVLRQQALDLAGELTGPDNPTGA